MARPESPWLDDLEKKVHEAARALRELRAENDRLAELNESLESRLAEAEQGAGKEAPGDWERERREIRDRVEKITQGLEELLRE